MAIIQTTVATFVVPLANSPWIIRRRQIRKSGDAPAGKSAEAQRLADGVRTAVVIRRTCVVGKTNASGPLADVRRFVDQGGLAFAGEADVQIAAVRVRIAVVVSGFAFVFL